MTELDERIATARENLRELVAQAAAYFGAADEDLMSRRLAEREALLDRLTKWRDTLSKAEKIEVAPGMTDRKRDVAIASGPSAAGRSRLTCATSRQRRRGASGARPRPGLLRDEALGRFERESRARA